jgi:hypothetical protein
MKKFSVIFATFLLMFLAAGTNNAQAQTQNVGQLVSGLITVNVGAINVGDVRLVEVGDVLSNNRDIRILENILNNSPIASNNSNFLNNLLRDANLITDNQVVVGVLSGGQLVIRTLPL